MNKIFMFFIFVMIISTPAFATDPDIPKTTTTASCADAILNTNGGNVNIEINWEPNVIPLRWYNGNTLVESNTCTYGGALTPPPPPPARTGYTFRGWRVRPTYDFTQLDNTINGSSRYSIVKAQGQDKNVCYYNYSTVACDKYIDFAKLQRYEWKVVYNYGIVYGMSKCSTSGGGLNGSIAQTISETEGVNCFCKVTGFQPTGESTIYGPSANMKWVLYSGAGDTEYCLYRCAYYCILMAGSSQIGGGVNSAYRARLFGQQN